MEWDLSVLIQSEEQIDEELAKIEPLVDKLMEKKGKISKFTISELVEFLNSYESTILEMSTISQFASLRMSANSLDDEVVALQNRISKVNSEWGKKLAFIQIELGALLHDNPDYIENEELQSRSYYLQRMYQLAKYRLSENEEVLIIEKNRHGVNEWSKLQGELVSKTKFKISINEEEGEYSWSEGYGLISNPDHETRKAALMGLGSGLRENEDIYAAALRNVCGNYITEAKRRGYENYLESSFFSAHLDFDIVDTMFEVLLENKEVFQDFLLLKAKILGTEKLRGEDLEAPFPFSNDRVVPWEEARSLVIEGFSEFDPEFGEIAKEMFNKNRIDGKPRQGKRAGAFCSTNHKLRKSFIMLSYNDNFDSLGTLAHESGHAVHGWYTTRNQNYLHSNYGMPRAETASEFGSLLFNLKFLNAAASDEERKAVLFSMINNFMIVIFEVGSRKLLEESIYEAMDSDKYLNAKLLNELYRNALDKVFGDAIEWLPEQMYHWCWKPHYYIPGFRFYNYPYVFGEFSVLSMYSSYKKDKKQFTNQYKEFLKAGGSSNAADMFQDIFGFDLKSKAFWENGIKELRALVDEAKNLVM